MGGGTPAGASTGRLEEYRQKRDAAQTPEPFGGAPGTGANAFVVQLHSATRLHYDLRLELGGALLSWAVPRGISADPADKKLALHVEDHPIEYIDFEGVIPEGEYGAGAMIVWDIGQWIPLEDPKEGLVKGKLLFELRGFKLKGVWTLVRLEKGESGNEWLLIRETRGGHPVLKDGSLPPNSVLSGLTVEQVARREEGWDPGGPLAAAIQSAGARAGRVEASGISFMLAKPQETPFDDPAWQFELKLDGYRMLAAASGGQPSLLTRSGREVAANFPEVARSLRKLPYDHVVLDGEVVVHDAAGYPSFQKLQNRARLSRSLDIRRASFDTPAVFYAFDLLAFGDCDLRNLPLRERRRFLQEALPKVGPLRLSEHFDEHGKALFRQVEQMGLEGIVAKRADSRYTGRRSPDWLKIHADRQADFVIVGFTEPNNSRVGLGALHLGIHVPAAADVPAATQLPAASAQLAGEPAQLPATGGGNPETEAKGGATTDGTAGVAEKAGPAEPGTPTAGRVELHYCGRVGTGFDDKSLAGLRTLLEKSEVSDPPFVTPPPTGKEHSWVAPERTVRVRYKEFTEDALLRHAVFLGMSEIPPAECVLPHRPGAELADPVRVDTAAPPVSELPLSNLDKVFWPDEGYTKGDLVAYYRDIAPWLLKFLEDRPLVLTRYPDGIQGKSFFQKNAPGFQPNWVRTEAIWSGGSERDIHYFIVDDPAALVFLANLGTIPLHIWASRTGSLDRPDWCLLDLDPKHKLEGEEVYAPFDDVVAVARAIHALCEDIGLPSFPKTSGSSGIHVMIPVGGQLDYEQTRILASLLAKTVAAELPDKATTTRSPSSREGKVYIDHVQNGQGRLVAAPYSVRPLAGATVSAPLRWSEVGEGLATENFTIKTMVERASSLGSDPLLPVLSETPDLLAALESLQRRFGA